MKQKETKEEKIKRKAYEKKMRESFFPAHKKRPLSDGAKITLALIGVFILLAAFVVIKYF